MGVESKYKISVGVCVRVWNAIFVRQSVLFFLFSFLFFFFCPVLIILFGFLYFSDFNRDTSTKKQHRRLEESIISRCTVYPLCSAIVLGRCCIIETEASTEFGAISAGEAHK